MKDKIFFDTNLWVYLYSDNEKGRKVEKLIEENFESIILSAQIIGEL
jgi:predicted nucleic acid-binding protein